MCLRYKNTLIKLKDVLPKVDEKKNKINLENQNITDNLSDDKENKQDD